MKYDDAPKFRTSVEPDSGAPEHETRKRGHILKSMSNYQNWNSSSLSDQF